MNIRTKYPLSHAGQVIPAGATAEVPENLARIWIARGQAEDAAGTPPSGGSSPAPHGTPPSGGSSPAAPAPKSPALP